MGERVIAVAAFALAACSFDSSGAPRGAETAEADGRSTASPDGSFCPDGVCEGDETPENCATDCGGSACDQPCSSCGAGSCCTETGLQMTCAGDRCTCELQCEVSEEGNCSPTCTDMSECHIDCRSVDECHPTCAGNSFCSVNCAGHDDGCDVICTDGARCLLQCPGSSCSFAQCDGVESSCPGDIQACNTGCP